MYIKTIIRPLVILILLSILTINSYSQMIPRDKQLHMGAGAVIGAWGMLTTQDNNGMNLWKPARNGMIWGIGAGLVKEGYDLMGYGTPEWKDLGATILGSAISVGIITGIRAIVIHHKRNANYGMVSNFRSINYNGSQVNYNNINYTFNHNVRKEQIVRYY